MQSKERNHYLVMKRSGFTPDGKYMEATESAMALLNARIWPLFKQTPCKNRVKPGQKILVYLAGPDADCQQVIASVTIDSIAEWSERQHRKQCPILLEDIPSLVLNLSDICIFDTPIRVKEHLHHLDLVPQKNPKKWGAALVGGMKTLTLNDYQILSGQTVQKGAIV